MHACHIKSITGCKLINQHVYQSHYICILYIYIYIYLYNPNNNPTLICLLSQTPHSPFCMTWRPLPNITSTWGYLLLQEKPTQLDCEGTSPSALKPNSSKSQLQRTPYCCLLHTWFSRTFHLVQYRYTCLWFATTTWLIMKTPSWPVTGPQD